MESLSKKLICLHVCESVRRKLISLHVCKSVKKLKMNPLKIRDEEIKEGKDTMMLMKV